MPQHFDQFWSGQRSLLIHKRGNRYQAGGRRDWGISQQRKWHWGRRESSAARAFRFSFQSPDPPGKATKEGVQGSQGKTIPRVHQHSLIRLFPQVRCFQPHPKQPRQNFNLSSARPH